MTGKLPGSAARDLEAETFTKSATDIIGKRIFVAGVVYSAYSICKDHSAGDIAINVLDNLVGAAGIWIRVVRRLCLRIPYACSNHVIKHSAV